MKHYFQAVIGLTRAKQRRFLRDKTALFFTFLFPLIFLFVFGSIFNNDTVNLNIALFNESSHPLAKQLASNLNDDKNSPLVVDKDIKNLDDAKEKMRRSAIEAIITIPKNFGELDSHNRPSGQIEIEYQKGSEQAGQTVTAIMNQFAQNINKSLGQPEPPVAIAATAIGEKSLTNFDYIFSGLLAFSIMSMGIFGLANELPSEKQKGTLRRLRASSVSAGQILFANSIHYLINTLLSVTMMLIVGITVFKFQMIGSWLLLSSFAVLSALMIIGFGLFIGSWAKNENQSAPLGNLVAFPMMFLSGAFFPSFLFPAWLATISSFIPLTPVVDGFRMIMTEHANIMTIAPQVFIILAWLIAIYFLSIRLFRWE